MSASEVLAVVAVAALVCLIATSFIHWACNAISMAYRQDQDAGQDTPPNKGEDNQ